jgi:low temperature requirement protein LtrA
MRLNIKSTAWWGAPKVFSIEHKERKISWLELFYDLVYVIAIAKITHHLSRHLGLAGLLDYFYFFIIIFWSWLNGSLYHDLHAAAGLRTRLMTLWQMLIVAALVVTIDSQALGSIRNSTIVIMIMQVYITYLWWSVGIYDKHHRRLNRPYTVLYLLSLGLMSMALFLEPPFSRVILYVTLILNYLPPFLVSTIFNRDTGKLSLSSSMSERLGLFTIIIFGEVISGVVNGVSAAPNLSIGVWLDFSLAVAVVFALWWIFFSIASDRRCKPGFINSSLLELLYIPALIALGLMGMAFDGMFAHHKPSGFKFISLKALFGYSLSLFFLGIYLMTFLLEYPSRYARLKKSVQRILFSAFVIILALVILDLSISLSFYLLLMMGILLFVIFLVNFKWYSIPPNEAMEHLEE